MSLVVKKYAHDRIALTVLLLSLSAAVWAGCKSDCTDEYESEAESCQLLNDDPDDSDSLTMCFESERMTTNPVLMSVTVKHGYTVPRATCLLVLLFLICNTFGATLEGKVIAVSDGDTITVLDDRTQHKIRLAEIDAPEKSQAFGNQSKKLLSDLVFDKAVQVVKLDNDRYGRIVGRVYVNGLDVNAEQVKRGMAAIGNMQRTVGCMCWRIRRHYRRSICGLISK